jgi:hypothetical protein
VDECGRVAQIGDEVREVAQTGDVVTCGGSDWGYQRWANLDQASKHQVFRFRDLSPTPIP